MALTICANCGRSTVESKDRRHCGSKPDTPTPTGIAKIIAEAFTATGKEATAKLDRLLRR